MIQFNTLKEIISRSLDKVQFTSASSEEENRTNKILTGCLVYSTVMTILNNNSQYNTSITATVEVYISTLKSTAESLSKKYISYKNIKNKIVNEYAILSFVYITQKQIEDILSLYNDKREIVKFDLQTYSARMYSVKNLTFAQDNYLFYVHKKIIVPIVKYYISTKNINLSDVVVESSMENNPGKAINISIKDVPALQIITDINSDKMNVLSNIYTTKLIDDNYAQIISK